MDNLPGCSWVVGRVRVWDGKKKKYVMAPTHCNKLPAPQSEYCPKHSLMRDFQHDKEAETYAQGK